MIQKERPDSDVTATFLDIESKIRNLLQGQRFSVLCTQGDGLAYGSLVAYAYTDDLKNFFFTTPTATRKYMLLSQSPNVSVVVDTRSDYSHDMDKIEAVTIIGTAKELKSEKELSLGQKMLWERHPYMSDFLKSENTALFRIEIARYYYVTRFQQVSQWSP
ncbi:MAG: pyridoxamine 5'-phosphate oxidase family protein [Candidatus Marinimicrobia bacterium]|nr:pyridoxamine 5'-phosphate oxidase family protein [Candidatus Neomarinimicrobiota bacterium]